jgi:erythromycin esterase-like protein
MTTRLIDRVRQGVPPLTGAATDDEPLWERIGAAHLVPLGEASHGTHEFSREQAAITKRLIAETAMTAVAVEADRPDAYRVTRYVRRVGDGQHAVDAVICRRRNTSVTTSMRGLASRSMPSRTSMRRGPWNC